MLKAKIDCTCYSVVRVESKERLAVPSMALRTLEFDPLVTSNQVYRHDFLLYFKELEE